MCLTSGDQESRTRQRHNTLFVKESCRAKYRSGALLPTAESFFVQDHWAAGLHRSPTRRRADFRVQFLRLFRLVAVAHGLSEQIAGVGQKSPRAFEWTLDLLFRKDLCAVYHRPRPSDSYREEHREITFGTNGNGQSVASADGNLSKLIRSKKESVREYSAAASGLDHCGG